MKTRLISAAVLAFLIGTSGAMLDCSGDEHSATYEADVPGLDVSERPLCVPGTQTCARGVVASCSSDGLAWEYSACDAGLICIGTDCVTNRGLVVIAIDTPQHVDVPAPIKSMPESLQDLIAESLCQANNECCSTFTAQVRDYSDDLSAVLAGKFWLREIASAFQGESDTDVVLVSPPTENVVTEEEQCYNSDVLSQKQKCIGGSEFLTPTRRFLALIDEIYIAGEPSSPLGLPAWGRDGNVAPGLQALAERVLRAPTVSDVPVLVDGIDDITNRELNIMPSHRGYPLSLLAFLAAVEPSSADTPNPSNSCRPIDIIHIGPFVVGDGARWDPEQCRGAYRGVQPAVWALWLHTGLGCVAGDDSCWPGSKCVSRAEIWRQLGIDGESGAFCLSDDIARLAPPGTSLVDAIGLQMFEQLAQAYPSMPGDFPENRWGTRLRARTHTILLPPRPADIFHDGLNPIQDATAAATLGGGVAITPCAPDVADALRATGDQLSPLISCDYATEFAEMIASIAEHRRTASCTPSMVGLPHSSRELLE